MGDMGVGNIGTLIGGIGSLAAAGGGIASGIQGKEAAQRAQQLQQQALNSSAALGGQSTLLGLAQLDLQRQLAERQIDFANQYLGETQPFRDRALTGMNTSVAPLTPQSVQPMTVAGLTPGSPVTLPDRTFTPTLFSQTPAERDTLEAQFRNARENTISRSGVRGGQLGSALTDLEIGRANAIVGLQSQLDRQNQALQNAAALTNFQTALENDRFNATDAINTRNMGFADAVNARNMNFADATNARNMTFADMVGVRDANANRALQTSLADRNLAAQIGFNAPGTALPALQGAQSAFNPAQAGAIFNPAMAAQSNAAGVFGQNFASANQQAGGAGAGLGSLAAAGKLANSKNGGGSKNTQTLSQFFGK